MSPLGKGGARGVSQSSFHQGYLLPLLPRTPTVLHWTQLIQLPRVPVTKFPPQGWISLLFWDYVPWLTSHCYALLCQSELPQHLIICGTKTAVLFPRPRVLSQGFDPLSLQLHCNYSVFSPLGHKLWLWPHLLLCILFPEAWVMIVTCHHQSCIATAPYSLGQGHHCNLSSLDPYHCSALTPTQGPSPSSKSQIPRLQFCGWPTIPAPQTPMPPQP